MGRFSLLLYILFLIVITVMFSFMNHYIINLWAHSGLSNLFSVFGLILCCMASILYVPIFMQKFLLKILLLALIIGIYIALFPYRHHYDPTGLARVFIFPNAIYNDILGIFSRNDSTDLRDIFYTTFGALYIIFPYFFYKLYIQPKKKK